MSRLTAADLERIRVAVAVGRPLAVSNRNRGRTIHWRTAEKLEDLGFLRLEWLWGSRTALPTDEAIRFIEALDRPEEGTES